MRNNYPPIQRQLGYKAKQTLKRIAAKVRFLNAANCILNGGSHDK